MSNQPAICIVCDSSEDRRGNTWGHFHGRHNDIFVHSDGDCERILMERVFDIEHVSHLSKHYRVSNMLPVYLALEKVSKLIEEAEDAGLQKKCLAIINDVRNKLDGSDEGWLEDYR